MTRLQATSGIDGTTRRHLVAPADPEAVVRQLSRDVPSPERLAELRWRQRRSRSDHLLLIDGIDPKDLAQTGWGIVFSPDCDPAIIDALSELLSLRKAQAGERFHQLEYRNETRLAFLARHDAPPGPVDPDRLPYYLVIVGSPREISFELQYELGFQYAVGRLAFDRVEAYAHYARSVVDAESRSAPRRAAFACACIDAVTERLRDGLVHPLMSDLAKTVDDWRGLCPDLTTTATKSRLARLLGGDQTPSFLFAAGHGLGFRTANPRQRDVQGALVCDEWSTVPSDAGCFAACDVESQADLRGLIAFLFSCYSAGLPEGDDFAHRDPEKREPVSHDGPFVAALPRRLLGHPKGSALAVVGHVDRLWTYSFDWPLVGSFHDAFADAVRRLLDGCPVGWAMEPFSQRYADLVLACIDEPPPAGKDDLLHRSALLTAARDARNYIVLGDPAVRLGPVEQPEQQSSHGAS